MNSRLFALLPMLFLFSSAAHAFVPGGRYIIGKISATPAYAAGMLWKVKVTRGDTTDGLSAADGFFAAKDGALRVELPDGKHHFVVVSPKRVVESNGAMDAAEVLALVIRWFSCPNQACIAELFEGAGLGSATPKYALSEGRLAYGFSKKTGDGVLISKEDLQLLEVHRGEYRAVLRFPPPAPKPDSQKQDKKKPAVSENPYPNRLDLFRSAELWLSLSLDLPTALDQFLPSWRDLPKPVGSPKP